MYWMIGIINVGCYQMHCVMNMMVETTYLGIPVDGHVEFDFIRALLEHWAQLNGWGIFCTGLKYGSVAYCVWHDGGWCWRVTGDWWSLKLEGQWGQHGGGYTVLWKLCIGFGWTWYFYRHNIIWVSKQSIWTAHHPNDQDCGISCQNLYHRFLVEELYCQS